MRINVAFWPLLWAAPQPALFRLTMSRPQFQRAAARRRSQLQVRLTAVRRRLTEEGCSVRGILTEERVAHARDLLQGEGLSVQEAAEACGYANRSHFARRIRAAVGVNPSDLRGR